MNNKFLLWALVCSMGLGVCFSCDEDTENEEPKPTVNPTPPPTEPTQTPVFDTPTINVDTMSLESYSIDVTSGEQEIHFISTTGATFNVTGDEAADCHTITIEDDGTICVKLSSNDTKNARVCVLTISVSGETDKEISFTINQDGVENANVLKSDTVNLTFEAQDFTVVASTGVQYMIRPQDDWISVKDNGRAVTDHNIVFAATENESLARVGSIWVIFKNSDDTQNWDTAVCVVNQAECTNIQMANTFSEWPEYTNAPYYNFAEENAGVEWPEPDKVFPIGK